MACQVLVPLYAQPNKGITLAVHDVVLLCAEWTQIDPEEDDSSPEKITFQYSTGAIIAEEDRLLPGNIAFPSYIPGMNIRFGGVTKTFKVEEIVPVAQTETIAIGPEKKKYLYQKVYTFRSDIRFVLEEGDEQCVLATDDEERPVFKTFRWIIASDEIKIVEEELVGVEDVDVQRSLVQKDCETIPCKNIAAVSPLCKYALEAQSPAC